MTPHSGGIPSPLAHLPGARHIPAGLACPSGGPCPQAACPGLNLHCFRGCGQPILPQDPPELHSTLHPEGRYIKASTASRRIPCHCGDLEITLPGEETAEATVTCRLGGVFPVQARWSLFWSPPCQHLPSQNPPGLCFFLPSTPQSLWRS